MLTCKQLVACSSDYLLLGVPGLPPGRLLLQAFRIQKAHIRSMPGTLGHKAQVVRTTICGDHCGAFQPCIHRFDE